MRIEKRMTHTCMHKLEMNVLKELTSTMFNMLLPPHTLSIVDFNHKFVFRILSSASKCMWHMLITQL